MPTPIRTSCRLSSTIRCVRSAQNVAPKETSAESDACGARYQHPGFGPHGSTGHPASIYRAWQEGHSRLLTCAEKLDELKATLRKPAVAARIKPYKAGRLVNDLKELAETIGPLPHVERSPDPTDDFLLALSEAG